MQHAYKTTNKKMKNKVYVWQRLNNISTTVCNTFVERKKNLRLNAWIYGI